MTPDDLVLLSSLTALAIAVAASRRMDRSPMAAPLAIFCAVQFGWMFCHWAHRVAPAHSLMGGAVSSDLWGRLDFAISPFTSAAALHYTSAFVGARRSLSRLVAAGYVLVGSFSLASLAWFGWPWLREAWRPHTWGSLHIGLLVPFVVAQCVLLLRHFRRHAEDPAERLRTIILVLALMLAVSLGIYDMFPSLDATPIVPPTLISMILMTFVAVDAVRRQLPALLSVYVSTLSVIALMGYGAILEVLASDRAVAILGIGLVSALLVAGFVHAMAASRRAASRMEYLAFLGRASAQLGHDLKNPLASIRGAAQFLLQERAEGRSIDDQAELLNLLVGEATRLAAMIDKYERLGSVEPSLQRISLDELVRRVVTKVSSAGFPAIDLELEGGVGPVLGDPVLLETALENVLCNGREAMPEGGTLRVRTGTRLLHGTPQVVLEVEDEGEGIDPRLLEEVFREFFTTKATGSGLGLPFVRRVMEAHGGHVELESRVGEGTRVQMFLPVS